MVALALLLLPVAAAAQDPCEVIDVGGTVVLPPDGCEYLSPDEVHEIVDGLPIGTTIELAPIHKNFVCGGGATGYGTCSIVIPPLACEAPGGALGGKGDCFDSSLEVQITGTGALGGFSRNITVPIFVEVHTAPRNPGDPVQSFDTDMFSLEGEIFGDPDFCTLRFEGGSAFGLPSPGHTTLTKLPSGNFNVDSFFDVTYEITFQGCPGSVLEGFGGVTQQTLRMQTGRPANVPGLGTPGLALLAVMTLAVGGWFMLRPRRSDSRA